MSIIARSVLFLSVLFLGVVAHAKEEPQHPQEDHTEQTQDHGEKAEGGHHSKAPAGWSVIPFVLLLLMIATGPLFYENFWHKNYPLIAVILAALVVAYYLLVLHNQHGPVHALAEYVQFISLLTGLYVASGGIMIIIDKNASPMTNVIILAIGAVIANVIGTTGASMLLIRPFIRLNRNRIKPYHVIFFIFLVSNIGGSLTPIGDPPLFLGFLKGVPFSWTLVNNLIPWAFAIVCLLAVFYALDRRNKSDYSFGEDTVEPTGEVALRGIKNFVWLGIVVGAVFLDLMFLNGCRGSIIMGRSFHLFVRY